MLNQFYNVLFQLFYMSLLKIDIQWINILKQFEMQIENTLNFAFN